LASDTELSGPGSGLVPVGRADLVKHSGDVTVDCAYGNHELAGDLSVRVALAEQAQHVDLAGGQASRVDLRSAQRPASDAGHAERPQAPADLGGERSGAKLIKHPERSQQVLRGRALRQRRGVLVRASGGLPGRGGLAPPACRLHCVGVIADRLNALPCPGQPEAELCPVHPVAEPFGLLVTGVAMSRTRSVAAKPGCLGARPRRGRSLQLVTFTTPVPRPPEHAGLRLPRRTITQPSTVVAHLVSVNASTPRSAARRPPHGPREPSRARTTCMWDGNPRNSASSASCRPAVR
jgi:hypothetical protein